MWKKFTTVVSLLIALGTVAADMDCVCRPLHPNPDALAARIASLTTPRPSRLKAAWQMETQLDVIDILIAFDASSVKWLAANGKGTPVEYGTQCIEKLNYCLKQSYLLDKFHFRLAGTVEVAEDVSKMSLFNVVLKMIDEYGLVVATGEWKKVTDAREALGADIVSVLTASGSLGSVGESFALEGDLYGRSGAAIMSFADWAYNACAIESVDEEYTLMHEVGHGMGCGHPDASIAPGIAALSTPGNRATGPQFYDYSSGWYLWDGQTGYYTIMSYNWGGLDPNGRYNDWLRFHPLPFFSTPNYTWKGHALGDSRHDNRRTLLNTYKYVAQYRISRLPSEKKVNPTPEPREGGGVVEMDEVVSGFAFPKAVEVGGCVLDATGWPNAAVSLKIGKAGERGTKVSGSVTSFVTGRKVLLKATTVDLSMAPESLTFDVRGLGTLSLKLGLDVAGKVVYSGMLNGQQVTSVAAAGEITGKKAFSRPAVPEVLNGIQVNSDLLPNGEPVEMKGKKWVLARAATIAYKKDLVTGEMRWLVNNGQDRPDRTNLSGLKLTYKPKTGIFSGAFTIYGHQDNRLKKMRANVRGIVVDGEGHGVSAIRGASASWPVTVK